MEAVKRLVFYMFFTQKVIIVKNKVLDFGQLFFIRMISVFNYFTLFLSQKIDKWNFQAHYATQKITSG